MPACWSWDLKFLFFLCSVSSDNLTSQTKGKEDAQELPRAPPAPVSGNLALDDLGPPSFSGPFESSRVRARLADILTAIVAQLPVAHPGPRELRQAGDQDSYMETVPGDCRSPRRGAPTTRDRSPTTAHWTWTRTLLRGLQRGSLPLPEGTVAGPRGKAQRTVRAGLCDSATVRGHFTQGELKTTVPKCKASKISAHPYTDLGSRHAGVLLPSPHTGCGELSLSTLPISLFGFLRIDIMKHFFEMQQIV